MLRLRLQDDQGVASVLISSGSEDVFLRQLMAQFYLVGSLFMVSISSAQPRFWLGLATDGAVGSSQFRGWQGFITATALLPFNEAGRVGDAGCIPFAALHIFTFGVGVGTFGGMATSADKGGIFFVYGTTWRPASWPEPPSMTRAKSAALGPMARFLWPALLLVRRLRIALEKTGWMAGAVHAMLLMFWEEALVLAVVHTSSTMPVPSR